MWPKTAGYWLGMRRGMPAGLATLVVGIGFGALARPVIGTAPAIVMSFVVFAGSAQLAAVATLGAGGVTGAAIAAGLLMNLRFLPMGVSVGPSLPGPRWRRFVHGQVVVDASWALARRHDGRFDRAVLVGATIPQAIGWWTGTIIGTVGGGLVGDPMKLGLDAVFPAFFLALLADDVRRKRGAAAAFLGAALATALTPVLPPGLPIAAASTAALIGLFTAPTTSEPKEDST